MRREYPRATRNLKKVPKIARRRTLIFRVPVPDGDHRAPPATRDGDRVRGPDALWYTHQYVPVANRATTVTRQIDGDVGGQDAALLAKVHAKTYDTVRGFPLDAVPLSDARLTTSAFAVTGTGPSALVATVTDKVAEQLGNAVDVGASLLATVPRPVRERRNGAHFLTSCVRSGRGQRPLHRQPGRCEPWPFIAPVRSWPLRAETYHCPPPACTHTRTVSFLQEVFFYNLDAQEWAVFSLVSSLQEDITAIAWRPLAKDGQLVVGSKYTLPLCSVHN